MKITSEDCKIDGYCIKQLTEHFHMPLYVYSVKKILEQIAKLKAAFGGRGIKTNFLYALKANSNPSILRIVLSEGIGLDCVSPEEIVLGLSLGFEKSKLTFTPSGVSWSEIEFAVERGVIVTLDSLSMLKRFGQTYGGDVPCMIRIRPNISVKTDAKRGNTSVGDRRSKFGIDTGQRKEILKTIRQYGIHVAGLHQHTGSGIKNINSVLLAADVLFDMALEIPTLQIIDLGGGFKVSYSPEEAGIDLPKFADEVTEKFKIFNQEFNKIHGVERTLRLQFEPGKYLVADSGYLLVSVNTVKKNPRGQTFVHVNSGLNHLIRPMLYEAHHEIINVTNSDELDIEKYSVVGYICETDTFAKNRYLPKVREGDILAICTVGAYGYSMASNYCGRAKPAEVMIINSEAVLIREREAIDHLVK